MNYTQESPSGEFDVSSYLTKKEIENAGFAVVDRPIVTIDGIHYTCCRRTLVSGCCAVVFNGQYSKSSIIGLINKLGFTHIKDVPMFKFPFYYSKKDDCIYHKNAISIFVDGFTLTPTNKVSPESPTRFKPGDKTRKIWAGDLVSECVFLQYLSEGKMLFYDLKFKCFRSVYWEKSDIGGIFTLNGWTVSSDPSDLL